VGVLTPPQMLAATQQVPPVHIEPFGQQVCGRTHDTVNAANIAPQTSMAHRCRAGQSYCKQINIADRTMRRHAVGSTAGTATCSKRTEPQVLPGVQQVDEPGFRQDVPDAQQADPQDANWLQQCPALHAAFVGHT